MTDTPTHMPMEPYRAGAGLWLPAAILLAVCAAALAFLPILPIDETRYLGVAWEMYHSGSFVVPLQNGLPYSHKPPMLFWLIHAGWSVFGVNAVTPRLTVCAIGIACLLLLRGISLRVWPDDRRTASWAALVFGSMITWMIWSSAIMFDVLMTCWVLVCVRGILDAAAFGRKRGWVLLAWGIAGGILSKGPVIFVYVLPLVLLHRFRTPWKWHVPVALLAACLAGLGLSLLWVIPAVSQGGDAYRHALLWSQTMDRVGESFSHQRPFWWYLPVLPALLLPWLFFRPAWRGATWKSADTGTRMALIAIVVPFLVFSAISCKQVQYLIPVLPAAALLMGRNIARHGGAGGAGSVHFIGALFLLLGLAAALLPFTHGILESLQGFASWPLIVSGAISMGAGLLLIMSGTSGPNPAHRVALATAVVVASSIFGAGMSLMAGYDVRGMARAIRLNMDAGRPVAHVGKYHGQFHFLGRLQRPLIILPGGADTPEARDFFTQHPDGLIVSNIGRRGRLPEGAVVVYQQRFRMKQALCLWGVSPATRPPADSHPSSPPNQLF